MVIAWCSLGSLPQPLLHFIWESCLPPLTGPGSSVHTKALEAQFASGPLKKKTFSATDIHWDPHSHTQPYPAIPTILSHTQPHSAILSDTQAYSAIPSHTQLYSAIPSHTQSYSAIYSHTHTQPFVAIPSHLSIFSHLQLYSAIAIHPPASYSSPCPATFTTSTTSQPSPIPNQAATSTAAISSMTKLSAFPADAALHQQQNRQIDPNTCDM